MLKDRLELRQDGQSTYIVFDFKEYQGRKGLNIRKWIDSKSSTGYKGPTKEGVVVPVERLKEVKEFIAQLE